MKERSRRKIQKIEEGVKKLEERREGDVLVYHVYKFNVDGCVCVVLFVNYYDKRHKKSYTW